MFAATPQEERRGVKPILHSGQTGELQRQVTRPTKTDFLSKDNAAVEAQTLFSESRSAAKPLVFFLKVSRISLRLVLSFRETTLLD